MSSKKPPPSNEDAEFRPDTAQPDTNDDPLDELILTPLDRSTQTTIRGPLSVYQTGFHWRTTVDATPVTVSARGMDAAGVRENTVIARGIVDTISVSDDARMVTLYVEPPR